MREKVRREINNRRYREEKKKELAEKKVCGKHMSMLKLNLEGDQKVGVKEKLRAAKRKGQLREKR